MTRETSRKYDSRRLLACVVGIAILLSPTLVSAERINIRFSPNTLNIGSEGKVVTIHTDVPYESVAAHTVFLNAVPISSWKADDRGNFVAKFVMDEIKSIPGLVINAKNTFQFIGETTSGEEIWAETEVMVVNRG